MIVIGRLSFCIYLVHLAVLNHKLAMTSTDVYLNIQLSMERSWVLFFEATFYAFLLSMFVEVPFMLLLKKLVIPKKKTKSKNINNQNNTKIENLESFKVSDSSEYSSS